MHRLENLLLKGRPYLKVLLGPAVHQRTSCKHLPESMRLTSVLLALSVLCGVLFYIVFRSNALNQVLINMPWIEQGALGAVILPALPAAVSQSFPSLVCGFSVILFIALLRPANLSVWRNVLFSAMSTLALFEIFLGYFHWLDIAATALGMLAGLCLTCVLAWRNKERVTSLLNSDKMMLHRHGSQSISVRQSLIPSTAVIVFSSLLAVGSTFTDDYFAGECARYSEEGYCEEYKQGALPVYMSYTKLRSSVAVESPRSPDRIGRLYLYGDYVFLNEVNEGIHIIDNTEPTLPVNVAFIRIPGNTEIAVRNNYLYADSYIDLITLDINDPESLSVIGREQSVFPYDSYQNIPQNITFSGVDVNRDQGVVVSYRLAGS